MSETPEKPLDDESLETHQEELDEQVEEASQAEDVLDRVMDQIELSKEASLEFFETEDPQDETESAPMEAQDSEDSPEEQVELIEDENLEFVEQSQALSIMESLLFSSDRPLGIGTFKQVFKGTQFKTKEIKKALEELQSVYAEPTRGVTLEEINGGWQLRTKVDNMDFLRKLAKVKPFKLSGPALEVLAIIAYKQPIVKNEVDQIRGVESGHLVRALMEKNLVNFQGKSELPGKPMQYGTTRKFLEIFGLRNLRELPSLDEIDQLLPDGIGVEEEDQTLSDVTDSLSENYEGNYSEGEEELVMIEDTLGTIDTSSEFFEEEKRRQKEKRDRDRARDIQEALDVGEDVEAKDQKWLARYNEKQAQMAEEAQAAQEVQDSGGGEPAQAMVGEDSNEEALIPESESIDWQLSQLSEQNLVEPEVMMNDLEYDRQDQESLEVEASSSDESTRVHTEEHEVEELQSLDQESEELQVFDQESQEMDPFAEFDSDDEPEPSPSL